MEPYVWQIGGGALLLGALGVVYAFFISRQADRRFGKDIGRKP